MTQIENELEAAEKKRRLKKTVFAMLLGGVVGFLGSFGLMQLADSGALGSLDASREIAALVGMLYVVTAAAIGFGLMSPTAGAKFLNVEDPEELREQKGMLGNSALGMATAGVALMVLAIAAPAGPIGQGAALAVFAVLMLVAVITSIASMKKQDELMKAVGSEAGAMTYYLLLLVGGTWSLLAHLGFIAGPQPLDWLTMFWALMLLGAFIVTAKRGMLTMR
ncbi:hypothetical protein [Erythrobacter alti]|uniref:hypothetical protein n=1 Tax=Erythrobacter alti TaxID=1896145 RepID=UPI0030F39B97